MERLTKIGKLEPKRSLDVKDESPMGLGMEKLDRDAFDPAMVYDKVASLGVKWIRLQSGWQKTEREEGVYDFAWLDSQVDALLLRGLKPWLCLCYGNTLYDDLAKQYFGSVGCPPIRDERAYGAWLNYVRATVGHFAGRIEYYEIWNEPEGDCTWRPLPNANEYAEFCVKTGKVIKDVDANAKVMIGSHYKDSLSAYNQELAAGALTYADAVTYHSYHYDETISMQKALALKALVRHYGREDVEVVQGEMGSQSKSGGGGALKRIRTNPEMQTKYLLRHAVGEILSGVKFTSYFSCIDMAENLAAKAGAPITVCGYFGLLGANFDKNTGTLIGDYYEKPSYYAFQNLCTLFDERVTPEDIPVIFTPRPSIRLNGVDCATRDVIRGGLSKANGGKAFAYWNATDLITCQGFEGSVTFELAGVSGPVRLVDPMDGSVYELGEDVMKDEGNGLYLFENIPCKDYPLILTFENF